MVNNEEIFSDSDDDEDQHQNGVLLTHLEAARIEALSPPKQDRATARGMVQFITPNTWSANVWGNKNRSYIRPIQKHLQYIL